ncbi:ABC transporter ATP-binding protein [Tanticharoenia sakaeratensis]|uniref:ABC transporter ATP-binding protein n=1 Tax=Tanticharoenia sakaeratensis NBRC 103193 TaxID=1231623 RepID=A0A0D6MPK8_9PROT|nr:ABC transporter ATP-binding protein [Tanticharoenia sakaeratensis]GAN55637.1 ABC transporter ATP-binding protein [Tanticharoenia sakaeratensis NBRC 103193]GBQ22769.1 cell division ATP-binding protein FtsE [Tanticharoenia sakaeratensis NBRC 103193]
MDSVISSREIGGRAEEGAGRDTPVIQADDVWLSVPKRGGSGNATLDILSGVSLDVGRGEAIGIVGPSGSGKTSLMMLLGGLERPTRGRIMVAGRDIGALSENDRALFRRDACGIVFQSFHLIASMSALDNVLVPLELAGATDATDRAMAALDAVGLAARASHRPAELSGGEQQRVALARAMVGEPSVLLADEPTGNLDPETGAQIMDLMFALRARAGTTLVLVTHDPALAARCDRSVRMQAGRIVDTAA